MPASTDWGAPTTTWAASDGGSATETNRRLHSPAWHSAIVANGRRTPNRWPLFGHQHRSCRNLLSVNLTTIHMLHCVLCIIRATVFHIAESSGSIDSPLKGKLNAFDLPIDTEDLRHMILSHIARESSDVDSSWSWSH